MSKRRDLTQGSIPLNLLNLTLPMMLGILSMVAFNLVDTFFVGKLGKTQLAALSFTFPVIMVIFSIVQGLGIGATALISRSYGKKDMEKAQRETTDSLALSVIIAGAFVIIGLATVKPTFILLGASEEILPYVTEYMTVWYIAILFVIVPFVGNSAIRATGDARTPSMIMMFAVIVNAILDPLLIFGMGPFPELGLKGAAYATAISRAMTMVLSITVLYFREKLITFKIPSWSVLYGCWKAILFIGLPSGLSRMIIPLITGIVTFLLSKHGESAVAAFGVGSRIEFLAMSILIALSVSIGPFTGQNFGATRFDRITKGIKLSNSFSIAWGLLMFLLLYFLSERIALLFSKDVEVVRDTVLFLSIVPIGFGFRGIGQIVNSNLNTLNKPIHASAIIIIQMVFICIPLLYLGSEFDGIRGIFLAVTVTYISGGIISWVVNRKVLAKLSHSMSNVS